MPLLASGFVDHLLTNVVTILNAYSTAQAVFDPGVAFRAERDRLTAPNATELESGPIVNCLVVASNPDPKSGSRDGDEQTATLQFDCYAASLEQMSGGGDKMAVARLYYLLEQVRAAISDKAVFDLGFPVGVIGKHRWGRWQFTPQTDGSELWVCGASWTFELDYCFTPGDLVMVDLEEVNVTVKKSGDPTGPYSTLWAALYPDLNV